MRDASAPFCQVTVLLGTCLPVSVREALENPSNPRENTLVIAGTDWAHGQQAARIQ